MARTVLVLLTVVLTAQVSSSASQINFAPLKLKTCPEGKEVCVELKYCATLARGMYFSRNKAKALQLMESYSCGLRHDLLQVCCKEYQVSESSGVDPSKLISGHRSLNFINEEGCGCSPLANRIAGGENASVGEFPWMAILIYSSDNDHYAHFHCGGSLISDQFVLTAAHCLVKKKNSYLNLIRVRLGEFNMNSDFDCQRNARGSKVCASIAKEYSVAKIIPHPYFDPDDKRSHHHDIGLIKLNPSVQLSNSIVPICLPVPYQTSFQTKQVTPSTPLIVAGWGMGETGLRSHVLRKLNVSFVYNDVCELKLQLWGHKVERSQMCAAGKNDMNACMGDSGGPLFSFVGDDKKHYQVGIVSFGYGKCTLNPVTIYTKVELFMRWILDNIR